MEFLVIAVAAVAIFIFVKKRPLLRLATRKSGRRSAAKGTKDRKEGLKSKYQKAKSGHIRRITAPRPRKKRAKDTLLQGNSIPTNKRQLSSLRKGLLERFKPRTLSS
jgi:hypothetical protein